MESTRKAIDEIIDVVALECKGRVDFIGQSHLDNHYTKTSILALRPRRGKQSRRVRIWQNRTLAKGVQSTTLFSALTICKCDCPIWEVGFS